MSHSQHRDWCRDFFAFLSQRPGAALAGVWFLCQCALASKNAEMVLDLGASMLAVWMFDEFLFVMDIC